MMRLLRGWAVLTGMVVSAGVCAASPAGPADFLSALDNVDLQTPADRASRQAPVAPPVRSKTLLKTPPAVRSRAETPAPVPPATPVSPPVRSESLLKTPAPASRPVVPASSRVTLTTADQKETYVGGAIFAENLRRFLSQQNDLGMFKDTPVFIAGMEDALGGRSLLPPEQMTQLRQAVMEKLKTLNAKKYAAGVAQLEALTAKKTVLKRQHNVFFVEGRKGTRSYKGEEAFRFDVKQEVIGGRVLHQQRAVASRLDATLPPLIYQAVAAGKQGGEIEVYCFASDIYPPEKLPEGVPGYALLKYTFTLL